jgi:hypothetical protein
MESPQKNKVKQIGLFSIILIIAWINGFLSINLLVVDYSTATLDIIIVPLVIGYLLIAIPFSFIIFILDKHNLKNVFDTEQMMMAFYSAIIVTVLLVALLLAQTVYAQS